MRKAHKKVIEAFLRGEAAHDVLTTRLLTGDRPSVSRLHTDGVTLYSYRMAIAKRERVVELDRGKGRGLRGRREFIRINLIERDEAPTFTTKSQVKSVEAFFPRDGFELWRVYDVTTKDGNRKLVAGDDFTGSRWAMPASEENKFSPRCHECGESTEDDLCRNQSCSCGQRDLES